jgi:hypothetical protein
VWLVGEARFQLAGWLSRCLAGGVFAQVVDGGDAVFWRFGAGGSRMAWPAGDPGAPRVRPAPPSRSGAACRDAPARAATLAAPPFPRRRRPGPLARHRRRPRRRPPRLPPGVPPRRRKRRGFRLASPEGRSRRDVNHTPGRWRTGRRAQVRPSKDSGWIYTPACVNPSAIPDSPGPGSGSALQAGRSGGASGAPPLARHRQHLQQRPPQLPQESHLDAHIKTPPRDTPATHVDSKCFHAAPDSTR